MVKLIRYCSAILLYNDSGFQGNEYCHMPWTYLFKSLIVYRFARAEPRRWCRSHLPVRLLPASIRLFFIVAHVVLVA